MDECVWSFGSLWSSSMGNKHTKKPKKSRGNVFNLRLLSNLAPPPPPPPLSPMVDMKVVRFFQKHNLLCVFGAVKLAIGFVGRG
jgi:hypothetical protein